MGFLYGNFTAHPQRGAMFGLDARIALAIFALLGVVTTAVIYKAIQQVKVTAIINQANEINTAITTFMLDTGANLTAVSQIVTVGDLKTSTLPGWKGPYTSLDDTTGTGLALFVPVTQTNATVRKWGNTGPGTLCVGSPCYYWTRIPGVTNTSIQTAIDEQIDGGDGGTAGLFWYGVTGLLQFRGPQALR